MDNSLEGAQQNERSRFDNNPTSSRNSADALPDTMLHLTTVIHTLVCAFFIVILYVCFANEWSFFTWHPLLMTIGVSKLKLTQNVVFLSNVYNITYNS